MKKYLFFVFGVLTCCGMKEDTDGLILSYVNMETISQTKWTIKSFENELSVDSFNAIDIEHLDLDNYPCVDSEEEKDYLFSLFTYTEWMIDSIFDYEGVAQNRVQWFWSTKSIVEQNSVLYSLGSVFFCNSFDSYLFAKHSSDTQYNKIQLYAVNVNNGFVVSVVQLSNLFTSSGDYGDYQTEALFQPSKRKMLLRTIRKGILMEQQHKTIESTSFSFSSSGKIIWNNY